MVLRALEEYVTHLFVSNQSTVAVAQVIVTLRGPQTDVGRRDDPELHDNSGDHQHYTAHLIHGAGA